MSFAKGKLVGQYINSVMAKQEAKLEGFDEAILTDVNGYVSEGSGENLFIVKNGVVTTPPLCASILGGITRDTVITLAKEEGIPLREEFITRDELYIADEVFFTGTAAELTRRLLSLGYAHLLRGGIDHAVRFADAARESAERHGDEGLRAWALLLSGLARARLPTAPTDPPPDAFFDEALATARERGLLPLEAHGRMEQSRWRARVGAEAEARAAAEEAARLFGELGLEGAQHEAAMQAKAPEGPSIA